jgi:ribonuclease HI
VEYTLTHLPRHQRKRDTPADVVELANNPDPEAIAGFSDGSALGNPGPCGAGALVILPRHAGTAVSSLSLGLGDNNVGEIAGLHQVLRLVDKAYERRLIRGSPPLLLFTDSLLVIGALEWGWSTKNMPPSIRALRIAYKARNALNPTVLYWVKGHTDVTHNETVDVQAKIGAARSRDWPSRNPTTRTRWTLGP